MTEKIYIFGQEADNRILARAAYDPRAFGTSAIVWEGMTQAEIDSDVENAWADHDYEPWRQKQDEIEACWDDDGLNGLSPIHILGGIIEEITIERTLARLDQGLPMDLDIDRDLEEIPAAEDRVEDDLVIDPKSSIKEASLEDKIRVLGEFNDAMVSYANRYVAGVLPPEHYERIPRVIIDDAPNLPVWLEPDVFNGENLFRRTALMSRGLSREEVIVEVHTEEEVDAARDAEAVGNEFDPYARLDVVDAAVE